MKTIISHPTGNQNVRAAASSFADADMMAAFHTAIATFPGDLLDRISILPAFAEIRRRGFDPKLQPLTRMWPWQEIGRLLAIKAGFPKLIRHEKGPFCIDAVYKTLDKRVASTLKDASRQGATAVYAYEDGALFSFREAKRLGLKCFYDLPIGYWRTAKKLLEAEQERWPEWASTLTGIYNSWAKLERKDEELLLADRIFTASQFTAKTLKEFPGKIAPIEVIPYGFPPVGNLRKYDISSGRPLKLLFVGGLSQRKGISYLFRVVESLGHHVALTVVGRKATDDCVALNHALTKHCWYPSLPHEDVLKLMNNHDLLIFPSLFEGFGLVITEAMSQGTPVITTDRTAGPDLIKHGENGWLIKAGSSEALQEAIEEFLSRPVLKREAGKAAMETARQRPWEVYGAELVKALVNILK